MGTISSALVTYAAIQALKPDLIINAGTAGGFKVSTLLALLLYSKMYVCSFIRPYLSNLAIYCPLSCEIAMFY